MNPKLQLAGKAAQVGALGLFEKLRPPVLRSRDDVPMSGADLTTEWLTEVLCRDIPGAQVVSFSTPGGSSGTSERLALRVEYNDAGIAAVLPTQLYTKTTKSFRQRPTPLGLSPSAAPPTSRRCSRWTHACPS
jgi:hypothetical protein